MEFAHKFRPGSEGRKLQQTINTLESDIEHIRTEILTAETGMHTCIVIDPNAGKDIPNCTHLTFEPLETSIPPEVLKRFVSQALKTILCTKLGYLTASIEEYTQLTT